MATSLTLDRDKPVNVHDGCSLLPFTLITLVEPVKLRYTIGALLELEQTFRRSLWTIIEQALLGTLGEEEQTVILFLGLSGMTMESLNILLNVIERREATLAFKVSQLELTRAIGHEVIYDDAGNPMKMQPRTVDSYKRADVRDTESFEVKKPKLETFGQWYELALTQLFQMGVTIPIEELMSMMPIELEAFFTAHDRRLIYIQKMAIFEAWHSAAFGRTEKLPDLEPIMRRIDRQSDKATSSKFTKDEAQRIIDQDKEDAAAVERLRSQRQQAKQSTDGEKK
jgi:hypothetical protein